MKVGQNDFRCQLKQQRRVRQGGHMLTQDVQVNCRGAMLSVGTIILSLNREHAILETNDIPSRSLAQVRGR